MSNDSTTVHGDSVKFVTKELASPEIKDESVGMTSADYYFDSYAHFGIHEEMLKDEVRTRAYMNAIMQNKHLFKDKVVLDVGCGTGILSIFAARAGAKHVYAVDMSSIIDQAKIIAANNGLADKITFVKGKIEEVVLPPLPGTTEPVQRIADILISEWMGYNLSYESMLDSLLYARDHMMVAGGLIFPDKATLKLAAIEDGEYKDDKIEFWRHVYGVDMTCIRDLAILEPLVDQVNAENVVTDVCTLWTVDMMTVKAEDMAYASTYKLTAQRKDSIHALVLWFDIEFSFCHKPVVFSTGPFARYTHWKQTVYYLDDVLNVNEGEVLSGVYKCRPNIRNHRDLDIEISFDFDGASSTLHSVQPYRLR